MRFTHITLFLLTLLLVTITTAVPLHSSAAAIPSVKPQAEKAAPAAGSTPDVSKTSQHAQKTSTPTPAAKPNSPPNTPTPAKQSLSPNAPTPTATPPHDLPHTNEDFDCCNGGEAGMGAPRLGGGFLSIFSGFGFRGGRRSRD
ncbi:hypothetical protein BC835DRAFT_1410768 [Cytidiella melzeri]|nr:hypothetical protein BC835DRAFT_1410768 [Cytidiella melzeri]